MAVNKELRSKAFARSLEAKKPRRRRQNNPTVKTPMMMKRSKV